MVKGRESSAQPIDPDLAGPVYIIYSNCPPHVKLCFYPSLPSLYGMYVYLYSIRNITLSDLEFNNFKLCGIPNVQFLSIYISLLLWFFCFLELHSPYPVSPEILSKLSAY